MAINLITQAENKLITIEQSVPKILVSTDIFFTKIIGIRTEG